MPDRSIDAIEYVCEGCGELNATALNDAIAVRDELIACLREDVLNLESELRLYRRRVSTALNALRTEDL